MRNWILACQGLALAGVFALVPMVAQAQPLTDFQDSWTQKPEAQYSAVDTAPSQKKLFFTSFNVPPQFYVRNPSPSYKTSEMWRALDAEFELDPALTLTDQLQEADYQVKIECAGLRYCSQVQVTIQDSERNILSTHRIHGRGWVGPMNVKALAHSLAESVHDRIMAYNSSEFGDYGYMHTTPTHAYGNASPHSHSESTQVGKDNGATRPADDHFPEVRSSGERKQYYTNTVY